MSKSTVIALLVLSVLAGTAEAQRATPLLDGVEASLEAVKNYEESRAEPNAKKLKLVVKLLSKLDASSATPLEDVKLLKKVAGTAEKKLADEAQVQTAVELTVSQAAEQARTVLADARSHLDVAPEGKNNDKTMSKVDKAEQKLEAALGKTSIKKIASALYGASKSAAKTEAKARSVAEAGVPGSDGLGGYYTGSGTDGEWVSVYISGAGELTVIAPGLATFKIQFDSSGQFSFSKNGCQVDGRVTDQKVTATAKCEDGTIRYTLTKATDSGSGAEFSGIYEQDLGTGGIQAMITPGGKVFFNFESADDFDSGRGTIQSDGSFSLESDYEGTVTGKATAGSGGMSGNYESPEGDNVSFLLQRASTGAPKPISIEASQGTYDNHIEITVDVPDTRSRHSLVSLLTYSSFTDQFADAQPSSMDSPFILGGIAPGKKTRRYPGTGQNLINPFVRNAPRIYFWAVIVTQDGESEPVGPVAGWTAKREMIPTVYLAMPGEEGEKIRSQYKSGTKVGNNWMRPFSNMPGKLLLTPAQGTVLPDGTHTIEVFFTPSVPGYNPVTTQFEVTVGGS